MIQLHRRSLLVALAALIPSVLLLASYATAASPTVLTFDDVAGSGRFPIPTGYGGVNWAAKMSIYSPVEPPYHPASPPNRILFGVTLFSAEESKVTFSDGPKIFDGAYFSGYEYVFFRLYLGGVRVAESSSLQLGESVYTGGSGPTFLPSGYSGPVNQVGIIGYGGFYVMDNFTFHEVPEPSSVVLCLAGIFATLMRRQRTRS